MIRTPASHHRHAVGVRGIGQAERWSRCAPSDWRRERDEQAERDRQQREQPEVAQHEQQADPQQAPIQALRVNVNASAISSAGITSAAQVRLCVANMIRANAAHTTSITRPEYVMFRPSIPCGRRPRLS